MGLSRSFFTLLYSKYSNNLFSFHRTIFWISLIYVMGHVLKTLAAIPVFYEAGFDQVWVFFFLKKSIIIFFKKYNYIFITQMYLLFFSAFSLIGLFLIAVGTGGIKPCVSAFGGDQFKLPEQQRQLQTFFSIFYFSINAGSLISTFITPIFR